MNFSYLRYFFIKDPYKSQSLKTSGKTLLNIIIFSKDRACQLDSLLRSIKENFQYTPDTVSVLYKSSNADFEKGYKKAKNKHILTAINWLRETDFQSDVKNLVSSMKPECLIMFLVDDNIVFRKIDITPLILSFQHKHLFISLRASLLYKRDKNLPVFSKTEELLEWRWKIQRKKSTTWNYPLSVDGNIYHAVRMQQILKDITFAAPNSFESAMHDYRKSKWVRQITKALSPVKPSLFNNPLNKVQTEGKTWHKSIDPNFINDKYLDDQLIDNSKLYNCNPIDTHHDCGLNFVTDSHH